MPLLEGKRERSEFKTEKALSTKEQAQGKGAAPGRARQKIRPPENSS